MKKLLKSLILPLSLSVALFSQNCSTFQKKTRNLSYGQRIASFKPDSYCKADLSTGKFHLKGHKNKTIERDFDDVDCEKIVKILDKLTPELRKSASGYVVYLDSDYSALYEDKGEYGRTRLAHFLESDFKVYLPKSSIDTNTVAHEEAHAFFYRKFHENIFINLKIVGKIADFKKSNQIEALVPEFYNTITNEKSDYNCVSCELKTVHGISKKNIYKKISFTKKQYSKIKKLYAEKRKTIMNITSDWVSILPESFDDVKKKYIDSDNGRWKYRHIRQGDSPDYGFMCPAGAKNVTEDISYYVGHFYEDPYFFEDLVSGDNKYKYIFREKLETLKEYEIIKNKDLEKLKKSYD